MVVAGEGGGTDAGEEGGLVAGADLVIGELGEEVWWDPGRQTPGCVHYEVPRFQFEGRFCLLLPWRNKLLYRSEEYCARERLWLGAPRAERSKAERQVEDDRIEESWEDWKDDSELE